MISIFPDVQELSALNEALVSLPTYACLEFPADGKW